jgi:hypothetical protein
MSGAETGVGGGVAGDRAGSELVGLVLLFGLVLVGAALVVLLGTSVVDDVENRNEYRAAELALEDVRTDLRTLSVDQGPTAVTLDVPEGGVEVRSGGTIQFRLNGRPACTATRELGTVRYRSADDATLAYQASGLWRLEDGTATMASPPSLDYRSERLDGIRFRTLTFPFTNINASRSDVAAATEVTAQEAGASRGDLREDLCLRGPDAGRIDWVNNVTITVANNSFYEAWEGYFREEFAPGLPPGSVDVDDDNRTVVVEDLPLGVVDDDDDDGFPDPTYGSAAAYLANASRQGIDNCPPQHFSGDTSNPKQVDTGGVAWGDACTGAGSGPSGPGNAPPDLDFENTLADRNESTGVIARADFRLNVTDPDSTVDNATVALVDADTSTIVDRVNYSYTLGPGGSARQVEDDRLATAPSAFDAGHDYWVVAVATDDNGTTGTAEALVYDGTTASTGTTDSDGDGVPDGVDTCPGSTAGPNATGPNGCGIIEDTSDDALLVNATSADVTLLGSSVARLREQTSTTRDPVDVSFVLDTSGSMGVHGHVLRVDQSLFDGNLSVERTVPADHEYEVPGTVTTALSPGTYTVPAGQVWTLTPEDTYRVNAGGSTVTGPGGETWVSGGTYASGGTASGSSLSVDDVTDPTDAPTETFLTERYGDQSWSFPVTAGTTYDVRLYFAETYWGVDGGDGDPGERVFDVAVEGTTVLDDYDIIAETGDDSRATAENVTVTPSDDSLDIEFDTETDNAKISAIEIRPANATGSGPTVYQTGETVNLSDATGDTSVTVAWRDADDDAADASGSRTDPNYPDDTGNQDAPDEAAPGVDRTFEPGDTVAVLAPLTCERNVKTCTNPDRPDPRTLLEVDDPGNDPEFERIDAADRFIDELNGSVGDRAGAVGFDNGIDYERPLTSDFDALEAFLENNKNNGGGTEIETGLRRSIDSFESDGNERVAVVLSDGLNDNPNAEVIEAAEEAADDDVTVYTIGLSDAADEPLLRDVAAETGGEFYEVDNASGLNATFESIAGDVTEGRDLKRLELRETDGGVEVGGPGSGTTVDESSPTDTVSLGNGSLVSLSATVLACDTTTVVGNVTGPNGTTYDRTECDGSGTARTVDNSSTGHTVLTGNESLDTTVGGQWYRTSLNETVNDYSTGLTQGAGRSATLDLAPDQAVFVLEFAGNYTAVLFEAQAPTGTNTTTPPGPTPPSVTPAPPSGGSGSTPTPEPTNGFVIDIGGTEVVVEGED